MYCAVIHFINVNTSRFLALLLCNKNSQHFTQKNLEFDIKSFSKRVLNFMNAISGMTVNLVKFKYELKAPDLSEILP